MQYKLFREVRAIFFFNLNIVFDIANFVNDIQFEYFDFKEFLQLDTKLDFIIIHGNVIWYFKTCILCIFNSRFTEKRKYLLYFFLNKYLSNCIQCTFLDFSFFINIRETEFCFFGWIVFTFCDILNCQSNSL